MNYSNLNQTLLTTIKRVRLLAMIAIKYALQSHLKVAENQAERGVITHIYVAHAKVYLLSIYDKSEQEDISDKDLLNFINAIR